MKLKVLRDPVDDDKFHDECGVFGVFGHPEAANLTYLGIHALQHRGQESAGIAALDGGKIQVHKAMGLVADIFGAETLARLPGDVAIGHTRYSTAGQSRIENAQPFVSSGAAGPMGVAHNGNLVNAEEIRAELEQQGAIFTGSSDTELLLHLIARERVKAHDEENSAKSGDTVRIMETRPLSKDKRWRVVEIVERAR